MAMEKNFINDNKKKLMIEDYFRDELKRAGYGGMEMKKTSMGMNITVYAQKPGMVIGRGGSNIKKITKELKEEFDLENPQIDVNEVEEPYLNPAVVANDLSRSLEKGFYFRKVGYRAQRKVMEAGARGVEIKFSGKLRGGRSQTVRFRDGYLKKCGQVAIDDVEFGEDVARLKPGTVGVQVRIMPEGVELPDELEIVELEEEPMEEEVDEIDEIEEELEEESESDEKTSKEGE